MAIEGGPADTQWPTNQGCARQRQGRPNNSRGAKQTKGHLILARLLPYCSESGTVARLQLKKSLGSNAEAQAYEVRLTFRFGHLIREAKTHRAVSANELYQSPLKITPWHLIPVQQQQQQ